MSGDPPLSSCERRGLASHASRAVVVVTALLLSACSSPRPCPLRDRLERLEAVDTTAPATETARAIATAALPADTDASLVMRVAQALDQQSPSFPFWERLAAVGPRYTQVADRLHGLGLPEAFAAVPFAMTGYRDDARGPDCRRGAWLLAPTDPGARVSDCQLQASPVLWSPPGEPEGGVTFDGACRIARCKTDDRADFERATDAALATLDARWRSSPDAPGKLASHLEAASQLDPALVLASHTLARCFYADALASWSARWGPRPAWCARAVPHELAEVERCSTSTTTAR